MTRVLADFHHSSLLRSLKLLFEDRLGMDLYRPIGMEWYDAGYWAINNQEATARQYLDLGSQPVDNTPPLNQPDDILPGADGFVFKIFDPGFQSTHRACTLDYFKNFKFDYLIASIPAHVDIFKELIEKYQPEAKLIVQLGNNWGLDNYAGMNVLASIAPQQTQANAVFYHQEFELDIFRPQPAEPTKKIYSFLNIIQNSGVGYRDYQDLQAMLERRGYEFKAYGGQCPDGTLTGPQEIADKMHAAQFVFHVKPGGDGFGHIIHNAYAAGRPVITRPSFYAGQLAAQLLIPGTFIDLDRYSPAEVKNIIIRLTHSPEALLVMGDRAQERFRQVVNYDNEEKEIRTWLKNLI